MPATINDLPYELFSQIFEAVICYNVEQTSRKTYSVDFTLPGLALRGPPDPDVRMQRLLKDPITPGSVRWVAANSMRQVNSRWHELSLKYAFRDLYVRSRLGNKRHMLSDVSWTEPERVSLAALSESISCLRKTAELLGNHPTLSSYVRRVWFDGYYQAKESDMIFGILHQCKKLEYLSIPWTALRHGTVVDWSSLFGRNATGPCIATLEIRATNLPKRSAAMEKENHFDNKMLQSVSVDFTNLASLRFFGNSKFMSITDKDLIALSRTANNLRELHVMYAHSLRPGGIEALIQSSRLSLEVLELDGVPRMEPEKTEQHDSYSHLRLSRLVAQCPLLRRLRLQSIRACRDIFACDDVTWSGKVQIYIGVNSSFQVPQSDDNATMLYQTLDQARCFMDARTGSGKKGVEIEIFTSGFIFEPRCAFVHGDFRTIHTFRESWRVEKRESHRNVQMNGYVREFPFCITEDEFKDGLHKGYVWL